MTPRGRRTTRNRPASRHGSSRRGNAGRIRNTSRDEASPAVPRRRLPRNGRPPSRRAIRTPGFRPSGKDRARRRPAGARPTSRSSRSRVPRPRRRRSRGWSAGRLVIRRPPMPWSPPTCWSMACAAARRSGTGSGSTSPRPRGRTTDAGGPRPGLRPVGGLRVARPGRPAGTCPTEEEAGELTGSASAGFGVTWTAGAGAPRRRPASAG